MADDGIKQVVDALARVTLIYVNKYPQELVTACLQNAITGARLRTRTRNWSKGYCGLLQVLLSSTTISSVCREPAQL